jgi:hypothetical protein
MTGTKYYHIYLKDECVLNNLEEDKFKESWELLNTLVGFMHTDYSAEDLSYERVYGAEFSIEESSY